MLRHLQHQNILVGSESRVASSLDQPNAEIMSATNNIICNAFQSMMFMDIYGVILDASHE